MALEDVMTISVIDKRYKHMTAREKQLAAYCISNNVPGVKSGRLSVFVDAVESNQYRVTIKQNRSDDYGRMTEDVHRCDVIAR